MNMSGLKFKSQSESILYLYSDLKVPIVMVALEQHRTTRIHLRILLQSQSRDRKVYYIGLIK